MNYRIKAGDTLYKLSRRFHFSIQTLARQNGIKNVNLIVAGDTLKIDGQAQGAEKKPTAHSHQQAEHATAHKHRKPKQAARSHSHGSVGADQVDRSNHFTLSHKAKTQMNSLANVAATCAADRRPGGMCLKAVEDYLQRISYGAAGHGRVPRFPFARNFAEYMNKPGNARRYGLKRLNLDNPYLAPRGAIIVVRAGTPGTRHPTAGDIVVKGSGSTMYNDGLMGYGGPQNFPPGNHHVLGIYVPA